MIVQEGINQDKIQEMNKALLLNLIREQDFHSFQDSIKRQLHIL